MRIKKFNELFDSEELKSHHELDILQGKNILKDINMPIDFKNESIAYLMHKLAKFNFPFLGIFFDNPDGIKFKNCETGVADLGDGFWMFGVESGKRVVSIGLRVNQTNDYDIFVYTEDGTEEGEGGLEYDNLTYKEIVEIIKDEYIPMLINNDFGDILRYGEDTSEINN